GAHDRVLTEVTQHLQNARGGVRLAPVLSRRRRRRRVRTLRLAERATLGNRRLGTAVASGIGRLAVLLHRSCAQGEDAGVLEVVVRRVAISSVDRVVVLVTVDHGPAAATHGDDVLARDGVGAGTRLDRLDHEGVGWRNGRATARLGAIVASALTSVRRQARIAQNDGPTILEAQLTSVHVLELVRVLEGGGRGDVLPGHAD